MRWIGPLVAVMAIAAYSGLVYLGWLPRALWVTPWPMLAALAVALAVAVRDARRRRRYAALVTTALLAAAFVVGTPLATRLPDAPRAPTAVGATPPDFTLPSTQGPPIALSSLRGHKVVLVFHRGHW